MGRAKRAACFPGAAACPGRHGAALLSASQPVQLPSRHTDRTGFHSNRIWPAQGYHSGQKREDRGLWSLGPCVPLTRKSGADSRATAVCVYGWEREWEATALRWQHMADACTGGHLPRWLLRGLWDLGARAVDVAVLRAIVHDFEERMRRGQPQRLLTMFHGGANHTARIAQLLVATGWYA